MRRTLAALVMAALATGSCSADGVRGASAAPPSPAVSSAAGSTDNGGPTQDRTSVPGMETAEPAPASPILTPSPSVTPPRPSPTPATAAEPRPTATPTPATLDCLRNPTRNAFIAALLQEIRARDREALAARMARSFRFVVEGTDVGLEPVSRSVAVRQLFRGVPDPDGNEWFLPLRAGAQVRCVRGLTLAALGADDSFWPGWDVGVLSTGWGTDGRREAIIVLGHASDGRVVWRGLFYTFATFELAG